MNDRSYFRNRGLSHIQEVGQSAYEYSVIRDISPFRDRTMTYANQQATNPVVKQTIDPLKQNVFQETKRSGTSKSNNQRIPRDDTEKYKSHIRIRLFSKFSNTALVMLIKYMVIQELLNVGFKQELIQSRIQNAILIVTIVAYLFISTSMYNEIDSVKTIAGLAVDVWNHFIIARTLIFKIIAYFFILIEMIDLNMISLMIIATIDMLINAIERRNNIDFTGNMAIKQSFVQSLYHNTKVGFNRKLVIIFNFILIYAQYQNQSLITSLKLLISLRLLKVVIDTVDDYIKNSIFNDGLGMKVKNKYIQIQLITSENHRISILALNDLLNILQNQNSLAFRNLIKDTSNIDEISQQIDQISICTLENIKQINDQIRIRNKQQRDINMPNHNQIIKNPQWQNKYGIETLNKLMIWIQNHTDMIQDYQRLLYHSQRISLASQCHMMLVNYLRAQTNEGLLNDQCDIQRFYNICSRFAIIYKEIVKASERFKKKHSDMYSSSHKGLLYSMLTLHSVITKEFTYGHVISTTSDVQIDQRQKRGNDIITDFKRGIV